jgi:DNA modification methylase
MGRADVKQYYKNPRSIDAKSLNDLKGWLDEFGELGGVVHDLNSDQLIGGNQRSKVFDINHCQIEMDEVYDAPDSQGTVGWGHIIWRGHKFVYRQVRWNEDQCQRANLIANRAGGIWDFENVLDEWDPETLLASGFSEKEVRDLFGDAGKDEETPDADMDAAEELQQKWGTKLGQIWTMGHHRLIVGDSTDPEVVARLMDGEHATCMWTDPPYGVEYVGKTADALKIENDGAADLEGLLTRAFATAGGVLAEGAGIYVAHPAGILSFTFMSCFINTGWHFHETLVWVKDSMVLGHSDYHYKHEPILYGWKGANRNWYGGRNQVSVFEIDRPKRSELHPTIKPVELIEPMLQNSTKRGDIVYEPFAGSGSTGIACEVLKRCCYMCELGPKYAAVILERFSQMPGCTPELIEDADGLPVEDGIGEESIENLE